MTSCMQPTIGAEKTHGRKQMGAKLTIFAFLLLLSNSNQGNVEYCKLSDLAVTQTAIPSKDIDYGYREYMVTVENRCICTQANVKLGCGGFNSSIGVDPDVLGVDGDGKLCTLNGGRPIGMGPDYAVKFYYAWSSQFNFNPVSSTIACS